MPPVAPPWPETNSTVSEATSETSSPPTFPVAVNTLTWCVPTVPDRCSTSVNEQLAPAFSMVPTLQSASPVSVPNTSSLSAVISRLVFEVFWTLYVNVTSPPAAATVSTSAVLLTWMPPVAPPWPETNSTVSEATSETNSPPTFPFSLNTLTSCVPYVPYLHDALPI